MEIKGITLLLNGDDGADKALPLARAALSNSAFELNVKDAGLAIEGHLGNLNIKDLRSSPKYPTILDIKGDHMVDFMFTITPCQEFAGIKDEYNIYIKVSNVRLIYIERFVSELMTYLAVFGTIFEATKQKVTEYLGSLYQNPTKGKLVRPLRIVRSNPSHSVQILRGIARSYCHCASKFRVAQSLVDGSGQNLNSEQLYRNQALLFDA